MCQSISADTTSLTGLSMSGSVVDLICSPDKHKSGYYGNGARRNIVMSWCLQQVKKRAPLFKTKACQTHSAALCNYSMSSEMELDAVCGPNDCACEMLSISRATLSLK